MDLKLIISWTHEPLVHHSSKTSQMQTSLNLRTPMIPTILPAAVPTLIAFGRLNCKKGLHLQSLFLGKGWHAAGFLSCHKFHQLEYPGKGVVPKGLQHATSHAKDSENKPVVPKPVRLFPAEWVDLYLGETVRVCTLCKHESVSQQPVPVSMK